MNSIKNKKQKQKEGYFGSANKNINRIQLKVFFLKILDKLLLSGGASNMYNIIYWQMEPLSKG